jgi:hypothetical protein
MAIQKPPLDSDRIEGLVQKILIPIRDNYHRGPFDRDRVYEALNALSYCVALTVQGAGDDSGEAMHFFMSALQLQMTTDIAEEIQNAPGRN